VIFSAIRGVVRRRDPWGSARRRLARGEHAAEPRLDRAVIGSTDCMTNDRAFSDQRVPTRAHGSRRLAVCVHHLAQRAVFPSVRIVPSIP
jgi:hypothetical protein